MTMDHAFRDQLSRAPDAEYDAIIRTDGDATPVSTYCSQCGITVHRQFTLVPGLSVTGTGRDLLTLADDSRVTSIEPDREIRAN